MDFSLDDEQRQLVGTLRRLVAASSPPSAARMIEGSTIGFDRAVWQQGCDLGWAGLIVPTACDGLGRDLVDAALVSEELGRGVVPGPFIATTLATLALIDRTAEPARADLLSRVAGGDAVMTWAFCEPGAAWSPGAITTLAHPAEDGGYRLDGVKVAVQDADAAELMVVTAKTGADLVQLLVPTAHPGLSIRTQKTIDLTRRFCEVRFDDAHVGADAVLHHGGPALRSVERQLRAAAVLVSADSVGVGRRLLDMTVEHVKVREQFDRPIGSFQAVKHRCASMRIWLQASASAMAYAAMAAAADTDDADEAASVAKAQATEHVAALAGEALQLHGGIGFTWEHDLHLYLRRAKANEMLFGTPYEHFDRLCTYREQAAAPGEADGAELAR